jgi:uncharacterized protein YbjT (DUF2867 family)
MSKRVFVTGGSGFVGSAVIEQLLSRGYSVNVLSRKGKIDPRANAIPGDLFDNAALDRGIGGCDAVVHLVGIIMEQPSAGVTFARIHAGGTQSVVEAAKRNGVRRYVHMSASGTRPNAASEYHRTKFQAEEAVRGSGLDWTIIRPSMIHGPRGEFTKMEAAWARKQAMPFLFMPYFGGGVLGLGGAGKLQPVFVDDVARAFVDAVENPKTIGQSYDLAGPDVLTWPQLHRAFAEAFVGKRRLVMPLPTWYARALTRIVPGSLLPFNRDQVIMSQEDNTADLSKFTGDFGWTPRPFRQTLESYASEVKAE